jgi:hypothetical protein
MLLKSVARVEKRGTKKTVGPKAQAIEDHGVALRGGANMSF